MNAIVPRRFFPAAALGGFLSLGAPGWLAQQNADVAREPAIELPTYTVTEMREMPPPEKWLYTRIEGFEVLSNASERATKALVRDFQGFYQAIGYVWPGVQRPSAVPAALIICGRGGKFDAFMPAGERRADRAMASLTLRNRELSAIVIDYEARVINLVTPEGTAASTAASAAAADDPTAPAGGGDPGFEVDAYRQLYREYIRFLLSAAEPRGPAWLEEGLAQIFMAMEVTKTSITVGKVEDPNTISAEQAAMNEAGNGGVAPTQDRDFNAALSGRRLLSMTELFAVTHDSPEALNPLGSTWAKQAYAFVHWGLYGNNGKHQGPFLSFILRLAREPLSEALFKDCFKMSYGGMELEIRGYVDFTSYKTWGLIAKKGTKIPDPPPFTLREATEAEIGRIKGDALHVAGHDPAARLAMLAPYIRGERDPQLLAALGLQERAMGDDARAQKFLEAAAQAKAVRPRAYLELARLRFAAAVAKPAAANGRLTVEQTAAVLAPLFTARGQPPPMPEVYELIADAWTRSAMTPTAGHLGVLDEGVRLFPRDRELVYADAALKLRAGLGAEAASLINLGLRLAPTGEMRDKFEALKAALPPPAAVTTPVAGK